MHILNRLTRFEKIYTIVKNAIYGANQDLVRLLIVGTNTVDDTVIGPYAKVKQLRVDRTKIYDDALLLLKKNHYNLVFIDVDSENIETIKQVRQFDSGSCRMPLIAVGAESEQDRLVTILSLGFDDYVSKPIDYKNIELVLNRWLKNSVIQDGEISSAHFLKSQKVKVVQPEVLYDTATTTKQAAGSKYNLANNSPPKSIKKTLDIEASLRFSHYNNELARDLLLLLIVSIKSEKNKVISCYNQKDWVKIGELTHKLYGVSCYCGVPILQEKAKAIEIAANTSDIPTIKKLYPELIQAMDDLLLWNETHDIDVIFNLE
jgi:two-component system sensor histidine kinase BarA